MQTNTLPGRDKNGGKALALAAVLLLASSGTVAADQQADTNSRKILYLANPYGFSTQQSEGPLRELVAVLESMGAEVWEPFARNIQIDKAKPGWAYEIGQADLRDVRDADGLFAVINGCPPDEGVMVELGMAIAWEKPVFLFRDDFRRCTDSEVYPLNLMVFTGLPKTGWEASLYSSVEELADPAKTLARWLSATSP
ncbi:MAG: nucleoside 2-deoxyribosyltransferase [Halieaceae bacterium]|nr:nucleoside 2-deoxyribosyltransferase [Halieaceae bacterium]